jgi:hypothetical protein
MRGSLRQERRGDARPWSSQSLRHRRAISAVTPAPSSLSLQTSCNSNQWGEQGRGKGKDLYGYCAAFANLVLFKAIKRCEEFAQQL